MSFQDEVKAVTRTKEEADKEMYNRWTSFIWINISNTIKNAAKLGRMVDGKLEGYCPITTIKGEEEYVNTDRVFLLEKAYSYNVELNEGRSYPVFYLRKEAYELYRCLERKARENGVILSGPYIGQVFSDGRCEPAILEKDQTVHCIYGDPNRFRVVVKYSFETKERREARERAERERQEALRQKALREQQLREEMERQIKQDAQTIWKMLYCVIESEKNRNPGRKLNIGFLGLDAKIVATNSKNLSETREFSVNLKPSVKVEEVKTFLRRSTRYTVNIDERTKKVFEELKKIAQEKDVSVSLQIKDSHGFIYANVPAIVTVKNGEQRGFAYQIQYTTINY